MKTVRYWIKEVLEIRGRPSRIFGFLFFPLIYVLALHDTLLKLVSYWLNDDSYSHGILLVFVSAYLLWADIRNSSGKIKNQSALLIAAIALVAYSLALTKMIGFDWLEYILAIVFTYLYILFIVGVGCYKRIFVPVFLLILATPSWWVLVPVLQTITVNVVSSLISLIGLTVYFEGNFVYIPSGAFEIAEGCAGLKYFLTGGIIAIVAVYQMNISLTKRLMLIASGFLIAMMANWIRVFVIILIGYYSEMQSSIVYDHELLGWVIYAVIMLPLMYTLRRFPYRNENQQTIPSGDSYQVNRHYINVFVFVLAALCGQAAVKIIQFNSVDATNKFTYPSMVGASQILDSVNPLEFNRNKYPNIQLEKVVYINAAGESTVYIVGQYINSSLGNDFSALKGASFNSALLQGKLKNCSFGLYTVQEKVFDSRVLALVYQGLNVMKFVVSRISYISVNYDCESTQNLATKKHAENFSEKLISINNFFEASE